MNSHQNPLVHTKPILKPCFSTLFQRFKTPPTSPRFATRFGGLLARPAAGGGPRGAEPLPGNGRAVGHGDRGDPIGG